MTDEQQPWYRRDRAMGAAAAEADRQMGTWDSGRYNHSHVTTAFMEGYTGGPPMPQPPRHSPNGLAGDSTLVHRADIYLPDTPKLCKNCRKAILMMCAIGTGYCSAQCKKDHTGKDTHEPYMGRNRAPFIADDVITHPSNEDA